LPAGLSWSTILAKRDAYTAAFKNWNIQKMAELDDSDVEKLLQPEAGLVRHKGKIQSAIHNAQLVLDIQKEHGSLAAYLWGMMPNKAPIVNAWKFVSSAACR
jgi:DNA-3-methyladenine glycosylase I